MRGLVKQDRPTWCNRPNTSREGRKLQLARTRHCRPMTAVSVRSFARSRVRDGVEVEAGVAPMAAEVTRRRKPNGRSRRTAGKSSRWARPRRRHVAGRRRLRRPRPGAHDQGASPTRWRSPAARDRQPEPRPRGIPRAASRAQTGDAGTAGLL